jgi:Lon protease-like protein
MVRDYSMGAYGQPQPQQMPPKEQSFAERFRIAGAAWAKADARKEKLQGMRGPFLEKLKQQIAERHGNEELSDARLERMAKASDEYRQHIEGEADAVEAANLAWVERKAVEMEAIEMAEHNANYRHESRLHRSGY